MALTLRPVRLTDAPEAGRICYEAFRAVAGAHNFPPDFPNVDVAVGLIKHLADAPGCYGVVAEDDGRVLGSNFLDERSPIVGIGPITVDPEVQNRGIGAALMRDVMARAVRDNRPGVRLLQAGYHCRSLCLYTRLGFVPREHLVNLQGPPLGLTIPGLTVRAASAADIDACNRLCHAVHGHDRAGSLRDAVAAGTARVVERDGRITGYTTELAFFGHAVGEANDDIKALIGAAPAFGGPGLLLPSRNVALFRWCLDHGLRMVQPLTLMTVGLYNEPQGAYLPSILF